MDIELINTGTELLLGRILNTHQQWLGQQLAGLNLVVTRQIAIPDSGPAIRDAVQQALSRADLIFTTGGLGPTADDVTRDLIAQLLERKLIEDPAIARQIEKLFALRHRPMPASTRVQALVPEGAIVLPNAHGTAPGLAIEVRPNRFRPGGAGSWLILLPGPPRELRPMFHEQVIPLLEKILPARSKFVCRTLKTSGLGESVIEEKIKAPLDPLVRAGLELGYCARIGEVEVRIASAAAEADALVTEAEKTVRAILGSAIYGIDHDSLEAIVLRELAERKETLALAESCTGGHVANRITNIPGASRVFLGGFVTYSDESKQRCLGVRQETLRAAGAVSESTAAEMAEGARNRLGADYALAVTGIAGPDGGSKGKPVGTVYLAIAWKGKTRVLHRINRYDRETFKQVTSQQGLELLRGIIVDGHD